MVDDAVLLRRYADESSQAAFEELVRRQQKALDSFRAANDGRSPAGAELAPYFESADLRNEFLLKAKGRAFEQELGATMAPAMEKAGKAFQAANGRPPRSWEDFLAVGAFLDSSVDRDQLFEVWHRLDAQFKQ